MTDRRAVLTHCLHPVTLSFMTSLRAALAALTLALLAVVVSSAGAPAPHSAPDGVKWEVVI